MALARCRLRRRDRVGARSELERGGVHAPRGEAHFWRLLIDHLDQRARRPDVVTGFSQSPFFQASDLLDRLAHNGGS